MFDVNLLNPPGIQLRGQQHVISYRENIPKTVTPPPQQTSTVLKKSNKTLRKWLLLFVILLAVIVSVLILIKPVTDGRDYISSASTSLSEIQYFTILNSMYYFISDGVYLEKAELTKNKTSIIFISDQQRLLNEMNHQIKSAFHHSGWIRGDLANGGRLVYQWKPATDHLPIQTVYVSKNVILDLLNDMNLTGTEMNDTVTSKISIGKLGEVLEKLDGLNHTLGISFILTPVEEASGLHHYKLIVGF